MVVDNTLCTLEWVEKWKWWDTCISKSFGQVCEATFVPLLPVLQGDYAWSTNVTNEGKNASVILDVRLRL